LKRGKIQNYMLSGRFSLHVVPVLVWLLVLACVIGLFYRRQQRFEVVGLAKGEIFQITAPCDGKLESVPVQLFEKVGKGQILAVFNDEPLQAQLATISAEIEHLMSQLIPAQERLEASAAEREANQAADLRRFVVDVEQSRLNILQLKAAIESDRILLRDWALEVQKNKTLLAKQAIAPYQLQKAQAQHDTLAKKIEENERLLAQAKKDLEMSKQRCDEFARRQPVNPSIEDVLEPIRKQITVQERLMDALFVQRKALTITSPLDGMVIQIQGNANQVVLRRPGESALRKAGEFVLAGDPILTLAERKPTDIIAYAAEGQISQIREGARVELIKTRQPAQKAKSQVTYVGVVVERMPPRLWRNPNIPQWGRPFLIKIPPGLELFPGEKVGIRSLEKQQGKAS